MNMTTWLKKPVPEQQYTVVVFTGQTYPSLFLARFIQQLCANWQFTKQSLDLTTVEHAQAAAQLGTSFLGLALYYWLGNLDVLDKKMSSWIALLKQYQGPHYIGCFITDAQPFIQASIPVIELPQTLTLDGYRQLSAYFQPQMVLNKLFVQKLFTKYHHISLDTACLLMNYQQVVGAGNDQFFETWLAQLVVPEKSLFTLSQFFLAKQKKSFFNQWAAVKDDFSEVFWTSFWSEQLWRAYYFIKCSKGKNLIEAKKISYRLPFSFIQRDWKQVTLEELYQAHARIYEADWQIKNGALEVIDTLYVSWFKTV
jgi:hypothetical protein